MQTLQACPGLFLPAGLMCSACWLVLGMLANGGGCTRQTKVLKSSLHSSWYSAFSSPLLPLNLWTVLPSTGIVFRSCWFCKKDPAFGWEVTMGSEAAWLCFVTCSELLKEFQYLNLKEHTLIEVMLWSCSWMGKQLCGTHS